jgi:hypothetical protein
MALLTTLLLSADSVAQEEKKRVVVLDFSGPGSAQVRSHVVKALSSQPEVELVSQSEAESAASRLNRGLSTPEDLQAIAAELQVSAVVEGTVSGEKRNVTATVSVRNGADGTVLHEEGWTRKSRAQLKTIRTNFWDVMGPFILQSQAPPPAAPPTEEPAPAAQPMAAWEQTPATEQPEPEQARAPSSRPALTAWIGPRLMWRNLSYEDDVNGNLRSYENVAGSPAFSLSLGARWFPGAHARDDFLADIGLEGSVDYTVGLQSKEDGKARSTVAYDLGAGLIYRLPLDMFEPRFSVGYQRHVFDVDTAKTTFLPAMTYSAVRIGLGTGIKIVDRFGLDVSFAYLYLLSSEELTVKDYFPKASGFGFDAGAGATLGLTDVFAIRVGVDLRRYSFDLNPPPGVPAVDAKVAKSASDSYLRTGLWFLVSL